jgi:REP-associated tyrosine transposase
MPSMDFRSRLNRPRAYNDPGHAHELTFSCFRRLKMLAKDRSCEWLARAVADACRDLNYSLWAYVFMPEHTHLIVCPRDHPYDTSDFLKQVKEPVSREAVQFLKRNSPEWLLRIQKKHGKSVEHHFWQPGRGFDRNILKGRTLQEMIDYVHLNPVRRGLVEFARDWKWSSAGWFERIPLNDLKPDPIPWDWLEDIR